LARRIVIKVGTSTLTGGTHHLQLPRIVDLVRQMTDIIKPGIQAVLVSSGAIAVGKEVLGFPDLPKNIPGKQMLAAVGQSKLMGIYSQVFGLYGVKVAQVLLTRTDIVDRRRYLNARNTIESLLDRQVIPIVNENDTVATEEIFIGDNDNLSALVANLIEADLLILLTDQEGIFTADPRKKKGGTLIKEIRSAEIPDDLWVAASGSNTELGTGGMLTKLQAAEIARRSGTTVIIANGNTQNVLIRIAENEMLGTWIYPVINKLESRKRFLLASIHPNASISIDKGAVEAIKKGGSLLPVGIVSIQGFFERGDIVEILSLNKKVCAVGITNYSSKEVKKIQGVQSSEIESKLGYGFGDEVVHHDNMTIVS